MEDLQGGTFAGGANLKGTWLKKNQFRFWHFSDIPPELTNVRYRG